MLAYTNYQLTSVGMTLASIMKTTSILCHFRQFFLVASFDGTCGT